MMFFGAIYYMVPRLTGNAWASTGLTAGHRVLVVFGVVVSVVTLCGRRAYARRRPAECEDQRSRIFSRASGSRC